MAYKKVPLEIKVNALREAEVNNGYEKEVVVKTGKPHFVQVEKRLQIKIFICRHYIFGRSFRGFERTVDKVSFLE